MEEKNREYCKQLESFIFVDPGNRGISKMWTHGALYEAAEKILQCDKHKNSFVLTGFCCMHGNCETDGPLGSSILCRTLRELGFNSSLLTDSCAAGVVTAAADETPVHICDSVSKVPSDISFVISCERPGKTLATRDYRTMRARDITDVTAPLDGLFPTSHRPDLKKPYLTIGIGDGGNEVGTGNIAEEVKANVPMGDQICVSAMCDVLIMAGVSNWGATALAAALVIVSGDYRAAKEFVEAIGRQSEILDAMLKYGSYDGVSGEKVRKIDGMLFEEEHSKMNSDIVGVVNSRFDF